MVAYRRCSASQPAASREMNEHVGAADSLSIRCSKAICPGVGGSACVRVLWASDQRDWSFGRVLSGMRSRRAEARTARAQAAVVTSKGICPAGNVSRRPNRRASTLARQQTVSSPSFLRARTPWSAANGALVCRDHPNRSRAGNFGARACARHSHVAVVSLAPHGMSHQHMRISSTAQLRSRLLNLAALP